MIANSTLTFFVGDGGWGSWESWGSCSLTCGNGTQSRTRACDNPPPNDNGQFCIGDDTEYRSCNEESCDSKYFVVLMF